MFSILYIFLLLMNPVRISSLINGPVLLCGGGELPNEIWAKFVALSGGEYARILMISTASENESWVELIRNEQKPLLESLGAAEVAITHSHTRSEKHIDSLISVLPNFTGIWFSGGYSCLLAENYAGEKFENALRTFNQNGGVVAGTSAGASMLADLVPRSNIGCRVNHSPNYFPRGFGLLKNWAVEQHLVVRNRQQTLMNALRKFPDYFGMGIDESTCALLTNGTLEVFGNSIVVVYKARIKPERAANPIFIDSTHLKAGIIYPLTGLME